MPAIIPGKLIYLFHAHTASRSTLKALERIGAINKKDCCEDHHGILEKQNGELIISTIRNSYEYVLSW